VARPPCQQLILDLRYAARQRMAANTALFAHSQTAQGRVAAFEARVADAIAGRLLAPQLAIDWTLTALPGQRPDDPQLLLLRVDTDPTTPEIALQLLPEWPRRMRRGGRPRDVQRYARTAMRRQNPQLWTILVVPDLPDPGGEAHLIFVPARGEYAHRAPAESREGHGRLVQSASGTLSLEEAVRHVLA